jgi:CxxC motif-containing protein
MAKEFICIVCPRGCRVLVDDQGGISGNQCKRGEIYVKNEMTNPTRILTTTVKTIFPEIPRASVKTDQPIPKGLLMKATEEINKIVIDKEMNIGDIVIEHILNTNANIVLTKEIKRKEERK